MSTPNTNTQTLPDPTTNKVAGDETVEEFDLSDKGLEAMRIEDDPGTNADGTDAGTTTAPTTPDAGATSPSGETPPLPPTIVNNEDGTVTIGGKWKGATMEDAVNAMYQSNTEAQRKITELASQRETGDGVGDEDLEDLPDPFEVQNTAAQMGVTPFQLTAQRQGYKRMVRTSLKEGDYRDAADIAFEMYRTTGDEKEYNRVLEQWSVVEPGPATQFHAGVQANLQQLQYQAQMQEAAVIEQQQAADTQAASAAFQQGVGTFAQKHPDWQQYDGQIRQYFQQNPTLMPSARGNAQLTEILFSNAYDAVRKQAPAQQPAPGGGMFQPTPTDQSQQLNQRMEIEDKNLAALAEGSATDVQITNRGAQMPGGQDQFAEAAAQIADELIEYNNKHRV
jgi:hypothetical protein